MKKIIIFLALIMSVLSNQVFAKTWKEFLTNTNWQLQNPLIATNSEIMGFGSDNELTYGVASMTGGVPQTNIGTYSISNRGEDVIITLTIGEQSASFYLKYFNENKIGLYSGDRNLIFAQMGSPEDRFMINLLNFQNTGYMGLPSGGYNSGSTQKTYEVCYTCQGTGRCKVCGGSGYYSLYGNGGPCKACSGSGKCWHCEGSGKQ